MRMHQFTVGFALAFCLLPLNFAAAQLRVLQCDHYRIHTDLEASLAQELAQRMDSMFGEYSRRLADYRAPEPSGRLEVYLFARRADYLNLVGNQYANSGGIFMPGRQLLAAFLEDQGRDGLRRTLQHEAFHQFAYVAIRPDLPVWFNEGLAQLFEEGIWDGRRFWMGQVPPRRVRQLRSDVQSGRLIDFRTFMHMTHDEWTDRLAENADAGVTQYNQSWAMMQFLAFYVVDGQPAYRQRLVQLLKLLREDHDFDEAFAQAFSSNIDGFQDRFLEFAAELRPTAEAALIEQQDVLGDLLSELSRRGRTYVTVDAFRRELIDGQYRLQYSKGPIRWQTDDDASIYFRDFDGTWLRADQLHFRINPGAPLPDIIRRYGDRMQLRTTFYPAGQRIEHEVVVENRNQL